MKETKRVKCISRDFVYIKYGQVYDVVTEEANSYIVSIPMCGNRTYSKGYFEVANSDPTVIVNGQEYVIDVEKAIVSGYLTPKRKLIVASDLVVGQIYKSPETDCNDLMLVRCKFRGDYSYQLLCMGNIGINSNTFYHLLHNLKEIAEHLNEHKMVLSHEADYKKIFTP